MNEPNDFHLTSGDGSILIEITSECIPITPEVLQRPRKRAPWMQRDKNGLPLLPPDGADAPSPPPDAQPPDGPPVRPE
jgi:hypothetical protein